MTRHRVCGVNEVASNAMTPVAMGRGTILLTRLPSGEIKAVGCPLPPSRRKSRARMCDGSRL